MNRSAFAALPFPYNQTLSALRTAEASALGTGLGTVPLIPLNELCPVPHGDLIAEHPSKERPARVRDGLSHLRALQLSGIDIADHDTAVVLRKPRGFDMVMVAPGVGDLAMDGSGAALA